MYFDCKSRIDQRNVWRTVKRQPAIRACISERRSPQNFHIFAHKHPQIYVAIILDQFSDFSEFSKIPPQKNDIFKNLRVAPIVTFGEFVDQTQIKPSSFILIPMYF